MEKLTPDLVLLDISLPDGSGCTHAGGCWLKSGYTVLILSVYDDPTVIREAVAAGAQGYVLKDTPVAMWRRRCDGGQWPDGAGAAVARYRHDGSAGYGQRAVDSLHGRTLTARATPVPLVAEGKTNKEIAVALSLSDKTVKKLHLQHVFQVRHHATFAGGNALCENVAERGFQPKTVPDAEARCWWR